MKKFYVIGNNSSKSLSPTIFNHWFKKYKIDASYGFVQTHPDNFKKNIGDIMSDKKVVGINITIPFKKNIIRFVQKLDKHSVKINAVNCLYIKSKTQGYNTDWEGYKKSLPKKFDFKNNNIIILGYGGAAQAIHYLFEYRGAKNIKVFNRSKKKLKFTKRNKYCFSLDKLKEHLNTADLIINTTPTNPLKRAEAKLVPKKTIVSDIVYSPKDTKFLNQFNGNKKIFGISMLLYQAEICFKIWFGFYPKIDKELLKTLEKKIS